MSTRINVSLKDSATDADLASAEKHVTDQGGKIVHKFKLIKGFTAEFPAGTTHTLATNDRWDVENDGKVNTQ